jgi:hypothetical protein
LTVEIPTPKVRAGWALGMPRSMASTIFRLWHPRSSDGGLWWSTLSSLHDAMQPILIATHCRWDRGVRLLGWLRPTIERKAQPRCLGQLQQSRARQQGSRVPAFGRGGSGDLQLSRSSARAVSSTGPRKQVLGQRRKQLGADTSVSFAMPSQGPRTHPATAVNWSVVLATRITARGFPKLTDLLRGNRSTGTTKQKIPLRPSALRRNANREAGKKGPGGDAYSEAEEAGIRKI